MAEKTKHWHGLLLIIVLMIGGWCMRTAKQQYLFAAAAIEKYGADKGISVYFKAVQKDSRHTIASTVAVLQQQYTAMTSFESWSATATDVPKGPTAGGSVGEGNRLGLQQAKRRL